MNARQRRKLRREIARFSRLIPETWVPSDLEHLLDAWSRTPVRRPSREVIREIDRMLDRWRAWCVPWARLVSLMWRPIGGDPCELLSGDVFIADGSGVLLPHPIPITQSVQVQAQVEPLSCPFQVAVIWLVQGSQGTSVVETPPTRDPVLSVLLSPQNMAFFHAQTFIGMSFQLQAVHRPYWGLYLIHAHQYGDTV